MRETKSETEKRVEIGEEPVKITTDFMPLVLHELKTPLAIIKDAVGVVLDETAGPINEDQRRLLTKTMSNIGRLKNLVDEMLSISKIESGRFKLHFSLVNLNDLLKDSSDFFKKLAKKKSIRLQYLLPKKQIYLFIDVERLHRVISNLIDNAIKFTNPGGKIKVEVKILEAKVRVGIIDTGIGISKSDLPKLFNKFVQISSPKGIERKGVGLGLAIAKELVEKHGGEIWVESKLGVGSKFYFTLPRYYTLNVLDNRIRKKINDLLDKGVSLYLISFLIVNYKEFKKRIKVRSRKLFAELKDIIETTFREVRRRREEKPQLILDDYKRGECNIIFPEVSEKKAIQLCQLLNDRIRRYFVENKIRDVFINLGVASYPPKSGIYLHRELLTNLQIKRVYIGQELRRFKRFNYKVNITILLPKNKTHESQTIDISRGGVCFTSQRLFKTDQQLRIKLQLPHRRKPLHIKGRVAWIKKVAELPKGEDRYKVGLEFIAMNSNDKKILFQFINSIKNATT
jgi:Tfp pilus assembly protein PilZ